MQYLSSIYKYKISFELPRNTALKFILESSNSQPIFSPWPMSYHLQSEEWCGFSNQSLNGLPCYLRIGFKIWILQIWESRFNQGVKKNFVILLHANTLPRDTKATKMKKPLVISKLLVQKSNLISSNSTFPFKNMIPVMVFTTPYNYRSTLPMINASFKPETIHFNATFNAWKKKNSSSKNDLSQPSNIHIFSVHYFPSTSVLHKLKLSF